MCSISEAIKGRGCFKISACMYDAALINLRRVWTRHSDELVQALRLSHFKAFDGAFYSLFTIFLDLRRILPFPFQLTIGKGNLVSEYRLIMTGIQ
jgi:hypothetical protein